MPTVLSNLLVPPSVGPLVIGESPVHGSDYGTVQSANSLLLLGAGTDKNIYLIGRNATSQVYLRPGNSASGQLVVDPNYVSVSSPQFILDQSAGTISALAFMVGASLRWTFTRSGGTEPGANVGSDFYFGRYSDTGAYIDNPITINRASGNVVLTHELLTATPTATAAGVRMSHGIAPTTPVNGDIWTTTAGLFIRINGVTVGPLVDATAADLRYLQLSGGNLTGPVSTVASATGSAGLKVPHGTAPTSPVNGDLWTTSADGLQVRVNGVTYPQAGVVIGGTKPTSPPVGTVWAPAGSTVTARSYAANISSGTTVVVTHNLATTDVVAAIYRLSDGLEVDVPFSRTSTNAITLNSAIDLAGHRVVILAAGG
jgi:hypothetical protein